MKNIKNASFYIISTLLIITCFLILQPKISSKLWAQKRKILWKKFINKVEKDKKIDPQSFWKFREFYCPGAFFFKRKGFKLNKFAGINLQEINRKTIFLKYNCSYLSSIELLTKAEDVNKLINKESKRGEILYQQKNEIVYYPDKYNKNKILIIFLKPVKEMKKANGFLDYKERDKKLVEGKKWMVLTSLSLP